MFGYTFMPEINKKSEKIVASAVRVPIEDREVKEAKKVEEPELTFHPNLKKKRVR